MFRSNEVSYHQNLFNCHVGAQHVLVLTVLACIKAGTCQAAPQVVGAREYLMLQ